jgi:hypothetical protein
VPSRLTKTRWISLDNPTPFHGSYGSHEHDTHVERSPELSAQPLCGYDDAMEVLSGRGEQQESKAIALELSHELNASY